MATTIHTFKIVGTSPLVMHNPAAMLLPKDSAARTQKQRIPSPEDEAEAGLYRLEDGSLYVKSVGFKRGILYASAGKKIGKMTTIKAMKAGVFEAEEFCPLIHPETGEPIKTYEVYITPVVVMKARVLRARPRIQKWQLMLALEINDDFVERHHVLQMLRDAGKMAGICDDRPQTGGRHGRYEVVEPAVQAVTPKRKVA